MEELFARTKDQYELYHEDMRIQELIHEGQLRNFEKNEPTKKQELVPNTIDELLENQKKWVSNRLKIVQTHFNKEYKKYTAKQTYFYGCTFSVYNDLYKSRLEKFLKNSTESNEIGFIELELKENKKPFNEFWLDKNTKEQISIAIKRRTEFLLDKAIEYDYKFIDKALVYSPESFNENELNLLEDHEIGLFSINQKIIALHKAGVLDCLRKKEPFNTNTNAMARLLAKITGDNVSSINKAITPILKQSTSSRNNPYNNEENENRVNSFFSNIGYDPNNLD